MSISKKGIRSGTRRLLGNLSPFADSMCRKAHRAIRQVEIACSQSTRFLLWRQIRMLIVALLIVNILIDLIQALLQDMMCSISR